MSRARDLAALISGGFTADDIPNLDASKITTGSLAADRIPGLAASKITSGTFDDARIAASNVSQHATSFDDNKLVNDISTLALRQASDNNKSAYNTNSSFVDVFQDSTGITNLTNTQRNDNEYLSSTISTVGAFTDDSDTVFLLHMDDNTDSSGTGNTVNLSGNATFSTAQKKFGTKSLYINATANTYGYFYADNNFNVGTGALTVECWVYLLSGGGGTYQGVVGRWWSGSNIFDLRVKSGDASDNFSLHDATSIRNSGASLSDNTWYHLAWTRDGSGNNKLFLDGVEKTSWSNSNNMSLTNNNLILGATDSATGYVYNGYIDEVRLSNVQRYSSNFTPNQTITSNATGSFENVAITAPSSVSSMGAIITYQDQAGTNALNTDIVLQLSADGGSNYSTATLTALPDFSTGIKMAKVNDLAVTAGTQLKYKINFANQASGSKEARIRGVALQY